MQLDGEQLTRNQVANGRQLVPPMNLIVMDPGKIDGSPLPAMNGFDAFIMVLQAADPSGDGPGLQLQFVADRYAAAGDTPGDDSAVTSHREGSIDRHAKRRIDQRC